MPACHAGGREFESRQPRHLFFTTYKRKIMIKIQTFTFSYSPREDRISFIANYADAANRIDFLVTRKKLLDLLNGFDEILINHCNNGELFKKYYQAQEPLKVQTKTVQKKVKTKTGKEEVKKVQVQETKNEQKWEHSVNTKELSLTKIAEPMLLDTLSYSIQNNTLHFKFFHKNELKAVASMSKDSFQQTISSLMRVIPFVAWGVSPHILD